MPKPQEPDNTVRLNKYLASRGFASRRKIDEWIDSGRIWVNDEMAVQGLKINEHEDKIMVDNKQVFPKDIKFEYWKVYKPRGVVSTARDDHGRPTVVKMVSTKERVYPVGRLDVDSEGLMLLTNDGELANKLTHPKHHVAKIYLVWVYGDVTLKKILALQNGVRLGKYFTARTEVFVVANGNSYSVEDLSEMGSKYIDLKKVLGINARTTQIKITLHEGKKRQIRRMCAKIGLEVDRLKRIKIGKLEIGEMRSGDVEQIDKDMI